LNLSVCLLPAIIPKQVLPPLCHNMSKNVRSGVQTRPNGKDKWERELRNGATVRLRRMGLSRQ